MSHVINRNSRVHVIRIDNTGQRWYLHKPETTRNARGELVLWPHWDSDPAWSRPMSYELACHFRERIKREQGLTTRFAFQAGDCAELIQD
jgi:hypothetical protein